MTAVVGLGAWRPKSSQCLDANRKLIKSFPVAGKIQAVRLVLPQPPPGAEPAESAPVAQYVKVATVLAMIPGSRKVIGETNVPSCNLVSRPAIMPRVTHGSGIGSQARST
jgi:hypothetical protein